MCTHAYAVGKVNRWQDTCQLLGSTFLLLGYCQGPQIQHANLPHVGKAYRGLAAGSSV